MYRYTKIHLQYWEPIVVKPGLHMIIKLANPFSLIIEGIFWLLIWRMGWYNCNPCSIMEQIQKFSITFWICDIWYLSHDINSGICPMLELKVWVPGYCWRWSVDSTVWRWLWRKRSWTCSFQILHVSLRSVLLNSGVWQHCKTTLHVLNSAIILYILALAW